MAWLFPVPDMHKSIGEPYTFIYKPMVAICRYILSVSGFDNCSIHNGRNIYRICFYPQKNKCSILGLCISFALSYYQSLLPILLGYGSTNAITSLVWNIIWGIYFILSDNVKTLIPKETRTVGRIDWILAAIGVVIPSVMTFIMNSLK